MNFRKKFNITILDLLFIILGFVFLLLTGYVSNTVTISMLEAVGTSLIAAGLVTYLTRRFFIEEQHNIELAASNREALDNEYKQRKYSAQEVDIVGGSLSGCLKEIADDTSEKILKRVFFNRAKIRLIFLDPAGNYTQQRALEDSIPEAELVNVLKQSAIYCVKIFGRLDKLYRSSTQNGTLDRSRIGNFEIRITPLCPHFTIYRADSTLLWGLYTLAGKGIDSATLSVPREQEALFNQLTLHFDKLWDGAIDAYLIRYFEPYGPTCNEKLFERLLGNDWKHYLE